MSDGRLCLHKALKKTMPQPNVQGLKIIKGMTSNYMPSYPRTCKTDEQKFVNLSSLFIKDSIDKPMFVEFAEVLKFQHPLWVDKKEEKIEEVLNKKAMRSIQW